MIIENVYLELKLKFTVLTLTDNGDGYHLSHVTQVIKKMTLLLSTTDI
jgi:hypothetical protein